jgi:hypothetical protein
VVHKFNMLCHLTLKLTKPKKNTSLKTLSVHIKPSKTEFENSNAHATSEPFGVLDLAYCVSWVANVMSLESLNFH